MPAMYYKRASGLFHLCRSRRQWNVILCKLLCGILPVVIYNIPQKTASSIVMVLQIP